MVGSKQLVLDSLKFSHACTTAAQVGIYFSGLQIFDKFTSALAIGIDYNLGF
jgi:hypothetical protein